MGEGEGGDRPGQGPTKKVALSVSSYEHFRDLYFFQQIWIKKRRRRWLGHTHAIDYKYIYKRCVRDMRDRSLEAAASRLLSLTKIMPLAHVLEA